MKPFCLTCGVSAGIKSQEDVQEIPNIGLSVRVCSKNNGYQLKLMGIVFHK